MHIGLYVHTCKLTGNGMLRSYYAPAHRYYGLRNVVSNIYDLLQRDTILLTGFNLLTSLYATEAHRPLTENTATGYLTEHLRSKSMSQVDLNFSY